MPSSTTVGIHLDETALIEGRTSDEFEWVRITDFPTGVDLFLGGTDEVTVNNADRLIEAINKVRSHALARIVGSAA